MPGAGEIAATVFELLGVADLEPEAVARVLKGRFEPRGDGLVIERAGVAGFGRAWLDGAGSGSPALGLAVAGAALAEADLRPLFARLGDPYVAWNTARGAVDGTGLVYELDRGHLRLVFADEARTRLSAIVIDREGGGHGGPAVEVSRLDACPECGAAWRNQPKLVAAWVEDLERDAAVAYWCGACGAWWRRFGGDRVEEVARGAGLDPGRCRG